MDTGSELLRNADVLAEFANLKPEDIEYFQQKRPDFVPPSWWSVKTELGLENIAMAEIALEKAKTFDDIAIVRGRFKVSKLWEFEQARVRKAWDGAARFSLDDCLKLILAGYVLIRDEPEANTQKRREIFARLEQSPHDLQIIREYAALWPFGPDLVAEQKVWPYMQAVMFLCVQSWRASRCQREDCRKYFVKEHARQHYCCNPCTDAVRDQGKRIWWQVNRGKKSKKSSKKGGR
jgi:hypothetical protein